MGLAHFFLGTAALSKVAKDEIDILAHFFWVLAHFYFQNRASSNPVIATVSAVLAHFPTFFSY
jgi:hypothetical protein